MPANRVAWMRRFQSRDPHPANPQLQGRNRADAATDAFFTVDLDFTGVTRPHQAPCRNENAGPFSNLEQRLSRLGGDRHIVWQKSNTNTHGILSRL